jgi:DNA-binding transcriptional LysR family regulator
MSQSGKNIDVAQLRSFLAATECGSIARVATILNRVPSALSMQLQKLEAQVGGSLFVRTRRGLVLTDRGRTLLPISRRMLAINDEIVGLANPSGTAVRMVVGTSDAYATAFMPGILRLCREADARFAVDLRCGYSADLWEQFARGELDAIMTRPHPSSTQGRNVHCEPLRWLAGAGTALRAETSLPLAMFSSGCADRTEAIGALEREGIAFDVRFSSNSHASVLAAVSAGLGVTAMLASVAPRDWATPVATTRLPELGGVNIVLAHRDSCRSDALDILRISAERFFAKIPTGARLRNVGSAAP